MSNFKTKTEEQLRKIDEKMKTLGEQKATLIKIRETEKQRDSLASKIGTLILSEFENKPSDYKDLLALFEKNLTADFDRGFFNLAPLSSNDPRRQKKRGRKKKEEEFNKEEAKAKETKEEEELSEGEKE